MSYVLHRNLQKNPPHAIKGDGAYLIDHSGKRYLDASGGAAVSCLGHSHPAIIEAIQTQVAQLPYAHTSFFTTDVLEDLAEMLVKGAPGMGKVLLLSGGSETIEAALKLSRQYFLEAGEPNRHLFIARRQSYHGNTLGALAVGGNEWRRELFRPLLVDGHHIAPCFEYRERRDEETQEEYCERITLELEEKLIELGPENVAGFVAETVVGATAGAVTAVPGYFTRIREICDRYGIHLILDEVMCGTGRTGSMMAYEQEHITPDMVTMAKGLAAGYQPVGALLCTDKISASIKNGSGYFQHGHTFMGHATAVAAALAAQKVIRDEGLLGNVVERGKAIKAQLRKNFASHPHVGDVRGRGMFVGVEFVSDRDTKEPLDPASKVHNRVQLEAMDRGLLCYGMGGTIDGRRGDHVLLAPPYNLDDAEQQELVEKFVAAVTASLSLTYPEIAK
jgi:adenosylmethionine-8-amino-7-oxononanoate aminotransferase